METLSDKEIDCAITGDKFIWSKDVKEFIRKLKGRIILTCNDDLPRLFSIIDELAGDRLIWKSNAITADTVKITKERWSDILVLIVGAKSI